MSQFVLLSKADEAGPFFISRITDYEKRSISPLSNYQFMVISRKTHRKMSEINVTMGRDGVCKLSSESFSQTLPKDGNILIGDIIDVIKNKVGEVDNFIIYTPEAIHFYYLIIHEKAVDFVYSMNGLSVEDIVRFSTFKGSKLFSVKVQYFDINESVEVFSKLLGYFSLRPSCKLTLVGNQ